MLTRFLSFCFILFAIVSFTGAVETYFEILDNEENVAFGTITALNRTQIVLDVQGVSQTIPLEKLVKIRNLAPNPYHGVPSANAAHQNLLQRIPAQAASSRRGANEQKFAEMIKKLQSGEQLITKTFPDNVIVIELKDGSRLTVSSFTAAKSQGICRLLEQQNDVSIPLNNISAVRLTVRNFLDAVHPPADWQRLAVPNTEGDRLIVGNPGSFDVYSGILHEVSAETVSFIVDGETLPVPRRKVFGLVMHGETPAAVVSPLATLTLWTGTRGMISDIQLAENDLTWQTSSGLTVAVPLSMVSEIDFGEQGVAYLTDFEQVRSEFSFPASIKPVQLKLLQTFYESRTKNSSREFVLDGIAYHRGMTLLGKTVLEYRLPKPFASLKAVIGIEDQFRPYAWANFQILADSQVLGSWELRGDVASRRIHLNLPQNCRLVTIIAEPVPQSNVSTVLTIAEPKLFE